MRDFVERLLSNLSRENLDYAILRSYDSLPRKPSDTGYFDIDLLVRRKDHPRYNRIVEEIARDTGCQIVDRFGRQYVKHICVARYTDQDIRSVFLDAHIDGQSWWSFYYLTEDEILEHKKKYNFFPVVCDFHRNLFKVSFQN